mmetsp:Transcript_16029/g.52196  ORF Transcript_16029/g.52196 Transcript_16029/m.52196 type:complete len:230 (-) Transcript_16029:83-772(-)
MMMVRATIFSVVSSIAMFFLFFTPEVSVALTTTTNRVSSRGATVRSPVRPVIEMKRKGKSGQMPGAPGRGPNPQMVEQQRQYEKMMREREDSGMPTFELYVRGPNSPSWYPTGALGGDDQSRQLVDSWMGNFLSDQAKGAIDRGVATSLFQDKDGFVKKVVGQYPQLKKSKNDLKFGYKISYKGLLEKRPQSKDVTEIDESMAQKEGDSFLDKAKSALDGFSNMFKLPA